MNGGSGLGSLHQAIVAMPPVSSEYHLQVPHILDFSLQCEFCAVGDYLGIHADITL